MTTYCDTKAVASAGRVGASQGSPGPGTEDAFTDALLKKQLEYVLARSEFYRRVLGRSAGGRPLGLADLVHLPFVTRRELQDDQASHPPFGSYLAAERGRIRRVHRTSGSTGRPLIIALSAGDLEDTLECGARCFLSAGVRAGDLIVHCLNYCMWSGGVTDHQALERAGAGVIPYGVGNSANLIRMMLEVKPTGIHCTPSYLAKLEQRVGEEFGVRPKDLGLRLGLFGGEPGLQDPNFRSRIERDWGFRAMDANYGMAEVLSMFGAECEIRDGLHFLGEGVIYPELKDPASDATLAWEPGARGELVLTHLRRQCQPLVRYCTSDLIEVIAAGPCSCGRTTPRWRVVGRSDDMLVIRGVNVYVDSIGRVVNAASEHLTGEYRVLVSRASPITDCLVKVEARTGGEQGNLGRELEDGLRRELGLHVPVVVVPEGRLPRTAGKAQRLERVL